MTVGLIVEHLGSNLIRDLSGFDEVYAKQTGCDREQAGQAVKQKSLEPQSSEIFLSSDFGNPAYDRSHDQRYHDHFKAVEEKLAQKGAGCREKLEPSRSRPMRCLGADRAKTGEGEPLKWSSVLRGKSKGANDFELLAQGVEIGEVALELRGKRQGVAGVGGQRPISAFVLFDRL